MSENKIELKDIYSDAILQGTVDGAMIVKRCDGRTRIDECTDIAKRPFSCQKAADLAEKLGGDAKVSYAIATILSSATIIYGKLGEAFLREKLRETGEEFSLEEYCNALSESVFREYNNEDKKQKVLDGIRAAMSDSDCIEANAAKAALMRHAYWDEKEFEKGDAVQEDYLNGGIVEYESLYDKMILLRFGEIEDAAAIENLHIVYDYLKSNIPFIAATYREIYPEVSDEKLLVYFIARLGYGEIERAKELSRDNVPFG